MPGNSLKDNVSRVTAFLWGFGFIHLFRYNLDRIYPFLSESMGLSFFAFCLIFLAWAGYASSLVKPGRFRTIAGSLVHATFFINALVFFLSVNREGEEIYLFGHPHLFILQMLVFYTLFSTTLRRILAYRVSLVAGATAGLLSYPSLGSIYIDLLLPVLLYVLASFFLERRSIRQQAGHMRMAPLRETLDLLRYVLLALALFGTFDIYRANFFLSVFLIAIGPLFSYILLKADKRKHHVKYGIVVLAIFFLAYIIPANVVHINYFAAAGFSFLTIWEGIYFKKTSEGYLKREVAFSGIALLAVLAFYRVSPEWLLILASALVLLSQLRVLAYVAKSYRKTISALFLVSLAGWGWSIFYNYNEAYKREFRVPLKTNPLQPPPPIALLGLFNNPSAQYHTNLIPAGVLKDLALPSGIHAVDPLAPMLLDTIQKISGNDPSSVQIYALDHFRSYRTSPGRDILTDRLKLATGGRVYLYSLNDQAFVVAPEKEPSLSDSVLSSQQVQQLYEKLAHYYMEGKEYDHAIAIYSELLSHFESTGLYREIANIYGIKGDTRMQIGFREKIILRPDATRDDRVQLMELYYLSGQYNKSMDICDALLYQYPTDMSVYEWKYRLVRQKNNRFMLEKLKATLMYTGNLDNEQTVRRDNLVGRINDDLKSMPLWNEYFNAEKKRQENIVFPE